METFRALIRDDLTLFLLSVGALFAGITGAVSWNSYCHPHPPIKGHSQNQESYDLEVARYDAKVAEIGKDAVVPLAVAVPMAVCGLFGAFVGLAALANRQD